MKTNFCSILLLITLCLINIGCDSKDDSVLDPDHDPNGETSNSIDYEKALLLKFPLSEIDTDLKADKVSIQQPKLKNGIPQEKGKITIELENNDIKKFSLKKVDFNVSDFTISPAIGEQSIIPGKTITYKITSKKETDISLEYDVLVIIKDVHPALQKLKLNGFSFLKANNPDLSQDITSIEVREHTGQSYHGTVMVIVPNETNLSNLIPTLDYEGRSIKFTTEHYRNHADFTNYTEDSAVDFKFPNIIAFRLYNSDETRYREYRILVDFKKIIDFGEESVTINNGNPTSGFNTYDNVIGFTYEGNYPITSDLSNPDIEITKTPAKDPANYYTNVRLREDNPADNDDTINTGEKGKLYIQLNFPLSFIGNNDGFGSYEVDATFNTMLNSFATPNVSNNFGGLENLNFMVYNPIKINIKATVFVTTE